MIALVGRARADQPGPTCVAAIAAAERAQGVPSGLLAAIGRVETGRRDAATAEIAPWPWSVDADGMGRFFGTEGGAIAAVRELRAAGVRSIDVGCLQVNLQQHPDAFATLAQAFDPVANASYAARFLRALFGETGSWAAAAAAYHSRTPALGGAYRRLVMEEWGAPAALDAVPPRPFPPQRLGVSGGFAGVEAGVLLKAASACVKVPLPPARAWAVPAAVPCRSSPFASTARLLRVLTGP